MSYKPIYGQQSPHRKKATYVPSSSRVSKYNLSSTSDEEETSPAYNSGNNNNNGLDHYDDREYTPLTGSMLYNNSNNSSVLGRTNTTSTTTTSRLQQTNNNQQQFNNTINHTDSLKASAAYDANTKQQAKLKSHHLQQPQQLHPLPPRHSLPYRLFLTLTFPIRYLINLISLIFVYGDVTISNTIKSPIDMNHRSKGQVGKKCQIIGWVLLVSTLSILVVYSLFLRPHGGMIGGNGSNNGVDQSMVIQLLKEYQKEIETKLAMTKSDLVATMLSESSKTESAHKKEIGVVNDIISQLKRDIANTEAFATLKREVNGLSEAITLLKQSSRDADTQEMLEMYKTQLDSHFSRLVSDVKDTSRKEREELSKSTNQLIASIQGAKEHAEKDIGQTGDQQVLVLLAQFEKVVKERVDTIVHSLDDKQQVEREKLTNMYQKAMEQVQSIQDLIQRNPSIAKMSDNLSSIEKTQELIDDALERYSADKTGMADYALWYGGGSIVYDLLHYPISQSYQHSSSSGSTQSILSLATAWFRHQPRLNPPETVLEPVKNMGDCWASQGQNATIGIRLSAPITITAVSIEHPNSRISYHAESAPRKFEVIGLFNETDTGTILGTFEYDIQKNRHLQTFKINNSNDQVYPIVVINVLNNYGYVYTCLYRIRVHGSLSGVYKDPMTFY